MVFAYPGNEPLAQTIAQYLGAQQGRMHMRHFPDGETYVRAHTSVEQRPVIVVCTLDQPNSKLLGVLLWAHTLRDLGASHITLVTPYLSYMRQDERFHPGEGVTSAYIATMISASFDELWTIAPHLHRHTSLDHIYTIPTHCVDISQILAQWIAQNVSDPLLVGPDEESAQWIDAIARHIQAPSCVLHKVRRGDRDVEVRATSRVELDRQRTPVIVDDIISTGRTMARAVEWCKDQDLLAPWCVGIHAVFSDDAASLLSDRGAARVVTTNTIAHATNAIDVASVWGQELPS